VTTPFGLYEFNSIPFGLTNAPATFTRLMERGLAGLGLKICLVFVRTFEKMLEREIRSCAQAFWRIRLEAETIEM
jgi:hypothetical protein